VGSGTAAGSESLRPATAPVTGGQAPSSPSAGGRATDRHGRGVTARGGAPAHGVGPGSRGKPSKDEPPKGEAGKAKAGTDKPKAKPAKGKVAEA
jgi:hypothetical protein